MSGIAFEGTLGSDLAGEHAVARMLSSMRHRGPDGASVRPFRAGTLRGTLGLTSLVAVREDVGAPRLPTTARGTSIAFDGRLDNRAGLLHQLGLASGSPDALVVASAYDRWGTSSPERLLGDFAFVLIDSARARVFGARDQLGVCPLFYQRETGRLRLASEKRALFADGAFRPGLRLDMVASMLVEEYFERDATFYDSIFSVPPGHCLTWTPTSFAVAEYWRLDPSKRGDARSPEEAAAQLRDTLQAAVRARLRANAPVAITVSGGLDSSSVAALAAATASADGLVAPALTTVRYDHGAADEAPFSRRVADHLGLPLRLFEAPKSVGAYAPSSDPESLFDPYSVHLAGMQASVAPLGARVFLGGWGSDELQPNTGLEVDDALLEGDVGHALRWAGLFDAPLERRAWRRLFRALRRRVGATLPFSRRAGPAFPFATTAATALIRDDRARRAATPTGYERESPARRTLLTQLTHGLPAYNLAHLGQLAAHRGLVFRFPFFDRRVVELLVSLPLSLRHDFSMSKPLLRKAIEPMLPASIAYRTFGPGFDDFFHELVRRERPTFERLFGPARLEQLGLVERGGLVGLLRRSLEDIEVLRLLLAAVTVEALVQAIDRAAPEPSFNWPSPVNGSLGERILW